MRPDGPILLLVLVLATAVGAQNPALDRDTDGDGLSDFHEEHKYLTDPQQKDSDGDGIADGEWRERREYQYTVRSVVQVMKPVTVEFLNDDYQDVRVLDDTETYVELEVIHYPFNRVASAIEGDSAWRRTARKMEKWTRPGPTADWTPALQREIAESLKKEGIDLAKLDDRELVERIAPWLLRRAESHDGFSTFITAFDEKGRPSVPDDLAEAAERGEQENGLTPEQQWEREISASGMFEHQTRGSCTSSSIYLNGCLRAVGIPTRTILCIPVIDTSDEREMEMVRSGLSHHRVQSIVLEALTPLGRSWTSHTFNEVFVGGRWRRLNYEKLGQEILDPQFLGLMTHIATFSDWADARMWETVGRRQTLGVRGDVFGGSNPYSTIALRDEFGPHCTTVENSPREAESLSISSVHWTDAKELPPDILEGLEKSKRFGLLACVSDPGGSGRFRRLLEESDPRVFLEAEGHPTLGVAFDSGCWWLKNDRAWIYLPFGAADRRDLAPNVEYRVRARNDGRPCRWQLPEDLRISR